MADVISLAEYRARRDGYCVECSQREQRLQALSSEVWEALEAQGYARPHTPYGEPA